MFKNIGKKIKLVAKIVCWLGIFCIILGGVGLMLGGTTLGGTSVGGVAAIALGILVAVGGSLVSWIGSFMTVGFGQLVENSDKIAAALERNEY